MTHPPHNLALRLEEIGSSLRLRAIELELEMDFTTFDAAVAELKTETANIETNQAAAVAAGVAAAQAADQAELEAKVASDLTPANVGFPQPEAPPATEPTAEAETPAEPDPNAPAPEVDPTADPAT